MIIVLLIITICILLIYKLYLNSTESNNTELGSGERKLLMGIARENSEGRPIYTPENAINFPEKANVFISSALDLHLRYRDAWVTLPLYRGKLPDGDDGFYIITEASDPMIANMMGINFAPRMANIGDGSGYQYVDVNDRGIMQFRGNIDFNKKRTVLPGDGPMPFPPLIAQAGGLADNEWSSFVIMPDGVVLNAQMVHNKTGYHDRIRHIDVDKRTVDMILLDGFQNGKEYFYHLVTDTSVELASALENGVVAPKLANIPTYASTRNEQDSAVLGFSPVLNGPMTLGSEQGFNVSIANKGLDPINIFPYGPDNIMYSPMWDAHVSQWTNDAVKRNMVRRITGFEDLQNLIEDGLVESAFINPKKNNPNNPTLFGLRATKALINCPVVCHPDASLVDASC